MSIFGTKKALVVIVAPGRRAEGAAFVSVEQSGRL